MMKYDFDGAKYKKASSHQKEWGARLIEELDLRGDERILDLGCGDGAVTAELSELVPRGSVLGIDASPGMIESARRHRCENLTFRLEDIHELDFTDAFDLLFSNAALHWILDHKALLGHAFCALADGGTVRFNFAGEGNCSHFFEVIREAMSLSRYTKYFTDFEWPWYMPSVEEYEKLIRQFPFADVRVWGENADRFFPDTDAMIKWVDQPSLVPFLDRVEQRDKAAFRQRVVDRMIGDTLQNDGTCFETFRRINVFAKK